MKRFSRVPVTLVPTDRTAASAGCPFLERAEHAQEPSRPVETSQWTGSRPCCHLDARGLSYESGGPKRTLVAVTRRDFL